MSSKLLLAIAAGTALALAGCGGGGGTPAATESAPTPSGPSQASETALQAAQATVTAAQAALAEAGVGDARTRAQAAVTAAQAAVTALRTARTAIATALSARTDASADSAADAVRSAVTRAKAAVAAAQAALAEAGAGDARTRAQAAVTAAQAGQVAAQVYLDEILGGEGEAGSTRITAAPAQVRSRVAAWEITHVEMSDLIFIRNLEASADQSTLWEVVCSGTLRCTQDFGIDLTPTALSHVTVAANRSLGIGEDVSWIAPINGVEISIRRNVLEDNPANFDTINGQSTLDGFWPDGEPFLNGFDTLFSAVGQYGAFSKNTRFFCRDDRGCGSQTSRAWAFGRDHHDIGRPTALGAPDRTALWYGAMAGTDTTSGGALAGQARLAYSFAANTIDVTISGIREHDDGIADWRGTGGQPAYSGPSSFVWNDLRVDDDGAFYIPGYDNDRAGTGLHPTLGYIDGDFYGPNADESAGVFRRSNVVGAWLAIRDLRNFIAPTPTPGVPADTGEPGVPADTGNGAI